MTPEGYIAAALLQAAETAGLFIRKCRWEGRIGCPDYLVIRHGAAIFIETKAPGGHPRKSQIVEFAKIKENGGVVYVVDTAEKAKKAINDICEKY